jgi:DNA-binding XRE family transcriptional regulator
VNTAAALDAAVRYHQAGDLWQAEEIYQQVLQATTAGQFNLNLDILRTLQLPLPPLEEQHEIVRRVEALFRLADAMEKRVAAATGRAEKTVPAGRGENTAPRMEGAAALPVRHTRGQRPPGVAPFSLRAPDGRPLDVRPFARKLRALREALGLTQKQLAERCGFCQATIWHLERGRNGPHWQTLFRLTEALGVRPKDFGVTWRPPPGVRPKRGTGPGSLGPGLSGTERMAGRVEWVRAHCRACPGTARLAA